MVFSYEQETQIIFAAIVDGARMRKYECVLTCCENLLCTCGDISVEFIGINDLDSQSNPIRHSIDFNINDNKISNEGKINADDEFLKLLASQLDLDDYGILYQKYFAIKNKLTETAPASSLEAHFDFEGIEKEGMMVPYNAVLPFGDRMRLVIHGSAAVVADHYCLKSNCSCADASLTIFFVEEADDGTEDELCTVAVGYKKRKWKLLERGPRAIPLKELIKIMEEQIPELYAKLQKRHTKLKGIYAHCKTKEYAAMKPAPLVKVGRNDPCSCGSGKKFKKCCGMGNPGR